jgi:hypothetical protein
MGAAIFILVTLTFGLVAYFTQLPPWITGTCSLAALGGYIAWTLRRRDRALKPLASEFSRLFEQFAARYGKTKSGKRFLEAVSKPTPMLSKMDEGMDDFMNAGLQIYNGVTDPGSLLLNLALAPVFAGIGKLVGMAWKDERTEEQKRCEAVLLHVRYTMDRRRDAYYPGMVVSALASVGIVVAGALASPPEFARQHAALEAEAAAPPVLSLAQASSSPVVEATPEPVASTPAPEPTVVARQEAVTTPTPAFATVAEAQRAAIERYPALSIGGSRLNAAFVGRYKLYKQTRPEYFNDSAWPMNLAVEVSQTIH